MLVCQKEILYWPFNTSFCRGYRDTLTTSPHDMYARYVFLFSHITRFNTQSDHLLSVYTYYIKNNKEISCCQSIYFVSFKISSPSQFRYEKHHFVSILLNSNETRLYGLMNRNSVTHFEKKFPAVRLEPLARTTKLSLDIRFSYKILQRLPDGDNSASTL